MRPITFALFAACLLCACGQKGALYLPGEEREPISTTTTTTTTESAATTSATDEERERAAAAARATRPN